MGNDTNCNNNLWVFILLIGDIMGTHFNIIVNDTHLGLLDGRTKDQECHRINSMLKEEGAYAFHPFRYVIEIDAICGELRKYSPSREELKPIFNIYDAVYWRREDEAEFNLLKYC